MQHGHNPPPTLKVEKTEVWISNCQKKKKKEEEWKKRSQDSKSVLEPRSGRENLPLGKKNKQTKTVQVVESVKSNRGRLQPADLT